MTRRRCIRGLIASALTILATLAPLAPAGAAPSPAPVPANTPGGLLPNQVLPQATTCFADGTGVCIVKSTSTPSCSGYTSQTTAPPTIRVLVHGSPNKVVTVDFRTYLKNVLPNEWVSSWAAESLKAGAVAVKSYAWYWVTHYGGYLTAGTTTTCFDVTDDTFFQVYRPASAQLSTSAAVDQTWGVAARAGTSVRQAGYRAYFTSSSEACGSGATGSSMSQWGSQNCAKAGYNFVKILEAYYSPVQLADRHQLRTPDDFVFAGRSTRALWDPSTGIWSINDAYGTVRHYGVAGDIPTVVNTGDGLASIGVFRPSTATWYLAGPSGRSATIQQWGANGDIPVPAHYNGISQPSVLATYRPSTGLWSILGRAGVTYGARADVPVPGHYSATAGATDYADGIAVYRPAEGNWYLRGVGRVHYGIATDIPAPGDYNGDGTTDVAVYRPSTHQWWIKGTSAVTYGVDGDIPVTGDFDGDGKFDIAVYRPSTQRWYVRGQTAVTFGTATGRPVGTAPYRD